MQEFKENNVSEKNRDEVKLNDNLKYGKIIYSKLNKKQAVPFTSDVVKHNSFFAQLKKTDEALLNSILSFSVYDKNKWMMEHIDSELSQITTIVQDAMKDKEKMYHLKVWHFIKNTFTKIPDYELKIPADGVELNNYNFLTKYSFKDGQYSAADGLAHASVLKSKNPNGDGYIMHLTFRGTEFSRLFEYIKGPYLDMSAYYENFKPLEKYLKQYANDPKNQITEIQVSGHSLGGAMVQEFLKNNPPMEKIIDNNDKFSQLLKDKDSFFSSPIKGYTFGSPGSLKKWYHKFATIAYHAIGRGFSVPIDDSPSKTDERITQFYHGNDPVPIVGLLGYSKGGNNNRLPDVAYEESKQAKLERQSALEKIPAFGKIITIFKENIIHKFNTRFHDSARYIMNLRNQIENNYRDYPQLGQSFTNISTKNWQKWIKEERNFGALSIKYKSAFAYLVSEEDPTLNKEQVNNKILQLREKMKYDSQADVVLSKTRSDNETYTRFLAKGTIVNLDFDENGVPQSNILKSNPLESSSSPERIQRLRKAYGEKMEERAGVFKKPS